MTVSVGAAVLFVVGGCVTMNTTSQGSFSQTVKARFEKWAATCLAGDVGGWLALWTRMALSAARCADERRKGGDPNGGSALPNPTANNNVALTP